MKLDKERRVLYNRIMKKFPDTEIYVLPQYVGFKKGKYYFAEIKIRTKIIIAIINI